MANSRFPAGEVIDVDPTQLTDETARLLGGFLRAEEVKKGKKGLAKRKSWEAGVIYDSTELGSIQLSNKYRIRRTPKRYNKIEILAAYEKFPDKREREAFFAKTGQRTIYIKKYPDGGVEFATTHEAIPKQLSAEKRKQFEALFKINLSQQVVFQKRADKEKKFFKAQQILEIPAYIYQVREVKKTFDERGVSFSGDVCGKIELVESAEKPGSYIANYTSFASVRNQLIQQADVKEEPQPAFLDLYDKEKALKKIEEIKGQDDRQLLLAEAMQSFEKYYDIVKILHRDNKKSQKYSDQYQFLTVCHGVFNQLSKDAAFCQKNLAKLIVEITYIEHLQKKLVEEKASEVEINIRCKANLMEAVSVFQCSYRLRGKLLDKINKELSVHIDPASQDSYQKECLDKFLLEQEQKEAGGKFNYAILENDTVYSTAGKQDLCLVGHIITRQPKEFGVLAIVGSDDLMPDQKTREKAREDTGIRSLYIKKNEDGSIEVCGTHKSECFAAGSPQALELEGLVALNDKQTRTQINYENAPNKPYDEKNPQQIISRIQVIAGYPRYVYNVAKADKLLGKGASGTVYRNCGKLKFIDGKSRYIPSTELRERGPRNEYITKFIDTNDPGDLKDARHEAGLLMEVPLLARTLRAKPVTFQNNRDGKTIGTAAITLKNAGVADRVKPELKTETVVSDEKENKANDKKGRGGELFDFLNDRENPLTPQQRADIFKLLLQAADEMAVSGLIHRDIKLENIIIYIDEKGVVQKATIVDVGFALRAGEKDEFFRGTRFYLPPESVFGFDLDTTSRFYPDTISDAFSFGLVLRMLCADLAIYSRYSLEYKYQTGDDWIYYLRAGFHLNLAMRDAEFSPEFKDAMGPKASVYEDIVNGMTLPMPNERLSPRDGLVRLSIEPTVKEDEKINPVRVAVQRKGVRENYNYKAGFFELEQIENQEVRDFMFAEACQQIRRYSKQLAKEKSDDPKVKSSLQFLKICEEMVDSAKLEINTLFPSNHAKQFSSMAIATLGNILMEEKKFLTDEGLSEHKQNAFRKKQILTLKSAFYGLEPETKMKLDGVVTRYTGQLPLPPISELPESEDEYDEDSQLSDVEEEKNVPVKPLLPVDASDYEEEVYVPLGETSKPGVASSQKTEEVKKEPQPQLEAAQSEAVQLVVEEQPQPSRGFMSYMRDARKETFTENSSVLAKLIKLPTEFLIKAIAESFHFVVDKIDDTKPKNLLLQGLRLVGMGSFLTLYYLVESARLLVRTVTSPMVSAREAKKKYGSVGFAVSVLCSTAAFAAATVFAAPAMAFIGAKVGLTAALTSIANVAWIAKIASPVVSLLSYVGVTATPALIGASFVSAATASVLAMGRGAVGVWRKFNKVEVDDVPPVLNKMSVHKGEPYNEAKSFQYILAMLKKTRGNDISVSGGHPEGDAAAAQAVILPVAVTPPLSASQGFAADSHPSLSEQRRDTPKAASGSYRRSGSTN